MIRAEQAAKLAQAAGHHIEDRLLSIRRNFLLEMGDLESVGPPDLAGISRDALADHPEQRGLSRAVTTDAADPLAGIDLKINAREKGNMAVCEVDIFQAQNRHELSSVAESGSRRHLRAIARRVIAAPVFDFSLDYGRGELMRVSDGCVTFVDGRDPASGG